MWVTPVLFAPFKLWAHAPSKISAQPCHSVFLLYSTFLLGVLILEMDRSDIQYWHRSDPDLNYWISYWKEIKTVPRSIKYHKSISQNLWRGIIQIVTLARRSSMCHVIERLLCARPVGVVKLLHTKSIWSLATCCQTLISSPSKLFQRSKASV